MRASLALLFTGLLIVIIVLGYTAAQGGHWTNTKEWLQAVLPAVTGLLGSAAGFYFGTRKGE
jgi:hypothetical protein